MKGSATTLLLMGLIAVGASAQVWQELTVDDFTLKWATVSGDMLSVELSATTTGWVAVGFDPSQAMLDANIVIGYVESGTPVLRDDFGWQTYSHRADTLLGGTHDLTIDGGTESAGTTEIQFTIPLNSGDSYDKELVVGNTYTILLAMSADGMDNFTAPHAAVASAQIDIMELALESETWGRIKLFD